MPEVQRYRDVVAATFDARPGRKSVIRSSAISAIDGHSGDHHMTERTHGSQLWMDPMICRV